MEFSRVQLQWEVFEPLVQKKGWESEAEEAQDTLKPLGMNAADSETSYTSLFTSQIHQQLTCESM